MSRESDDFIAQLVKDPKDPPDLLLLSGYLGASHEKWHVRLYFDEELCRYVDIPTGIIRHARELSPEQSPLGGSLLWIDRDAVVLHGEVGGERRLECFHEGQLRQASKKSVAAVPPARPAARSYEGVYPSVPCITPLISRQIPCRPPGSPFVQQHYFDFLRRDP